MILRGDSKELLEFTKSVDFNKTIKEIKQCDCKSSWVLLLSFPFQDQSALFCHKANAVYSQDLVLFVTCCFVME